MVVTFLPCAAAAKVRQERTRRPSRCTVQAPHCPWSTALLRAGQAEVLAQGIEERGV